LKDDDDEISQQSIFLGGTLLSEVLWTTCCSKCMWPCYPIQSCCTIKRQKPYLRLPFIQKITHDLSKMGRMWRCVIAKRLSKAELEILSNQGVTDPTPLGKKKIQACVPFQRSPCFVLFIDGVYSVLTQHTHTHTHTHTHVTSNGLWLADQLVHLSCV